MNLQGGTVSASEVLEMARTGEPERYLAALLAPTPLRGDLLAIAAFAAELARIPQIVREPTMGEIRLQWWRDVIEAALRGELELGGGAGHPSAMALGAAIQRHRLAGPLLYAMTEARAFDLYDDPMPDSAAFHGYLDKTASVPFALSATIVGADVPASIIDNAGRALGRARLLALLPASLSRGRNPLPSTLLVEVGCDPGELLAGQWTEGTRRLIMRVAADATADLERARRGTANLSRGQRAIFLPLATIRPYLLSLTRTGHNPLTTTSDITPLKRVTRIWQAHWFGL